MIECNNGKHVISDHDEQLALDGHVVKCGDPKCDSYVRYVKEYSDSYFVQDLGKKRN
jgi:hypothetical protein